ncbi:MAG: hypothetical protein ABIQ11_12215 [Saprospiraceae bacterium]
MMRSPRETGGMPDMWDTGRLVSCRTGMRACRSNHAGLMMRYELSVLQFQLHLEASKIVMWYTSGILLSGIRYP